MSHAGGAHVEWPIGCPSHMHLSGIFGSHTTTGSLVAASVQGEVVTTPSAIVTAYIILQAQASVCTASRPAGVARVL